MFVKRRKKSKPKKRRPANARRVVWHADFLAPGYFGESDAPAPKALTEQIQLDSLGGFTEIDSIQAAREAELQEIIQRLPPRNLSELRRVGIPDREIAIHLLFIRLTDQEKPKNLATVPGVPMKDIRKLPGRLREIARQVDAINKHKAMPSIFFWRSRKAIPGSLYSYAHALETKLASQESAKLKPLEASTAAKVQLVQCVLEKSKDRKQHYRTVAALINAFNESQDDEHGGRSKAVTAASLKQLWLEHKDLRKAPEMPTPPPVRSGGSLSGFTIPGRPGS